jgi:hypothetical protein
MSQQSHTVQKFKNRHKTEIRRSIETTETPKIFRAADFVNRAMSTLVGRNHCVRPTAELRFEE